MALNIKDESVHDAAKQLARLTGESQAQAVATAVNERLAKLRQDDLAPRIMPLGHRTGRRMTAETKGFDAEMLYDDEGRAPDSPGPPGVCGLRQAKRAPGPIEFR